MSHQTLDITGVSGMKSSYFCVTQSIFKVPSNSIQFAKLSSLSFTLGLLGLGSGGVGRRQVSGLSGPYKWEKKSSHPQKFPNGKFPNSVRRERLNAVQPKNYKYSVYMFIFQGY